MNGTAITILSFVLVGVLIAVGMVGCPKYRVYSQTCTGKADFAEAEINRQIVVEEARADEEALQMRANGEAEREKIRADASAYAINKLKEELGSPEAYLRWLWINSVPDSEGERIYIATEAGMPILEAK